MRVLKVSQIAKLYFKITPFIFGEGFTVLGLLTISKSESTLEVIGGIVAALVGLGIIAFKIQRTRKFCYSFTNGLHTTATIVSIQDSGWRHNGRDVMRYNFEYCINGTKKNFIFNSGYNRELTYGPSMDLYFDSRYPENPFIPKLFGLEVKTRPGLR